MNTIEGKIEDLGRQFSQLQKKLDKQKENGEKKAEEVITSTKEEIEQLMNQIKQRCADNKDVFSEDLIQTRYVVQQHREQRKEQLEVKHSEQRKRKAEITVEAAVEYAQAAMEFALLALDEATLAFYEAVEQADRYHQMYEDGE